MEAAAAGEGRPRCAAAPGAMAPMGIRLSPLGVAVFCLLGLGVLYHLYSGFMAGRFSLFGLGGEFGAGAAGPVAAADGSSVDLREMLAVSVLAAMRGGDEVRRVRESNVLHEKSKGKTREGADDKMTSGDVLSNRKMFYLLKTAFPNVQVRAGAPGLAGLAPILRARRPKCTSATCAEVLLPAAASGGSGVGPPRTRVLLLAAPPGHRASGKRLRKTFDFHTLGASVERETAGTPTHTHHTNPPPRGWAKTPSSSILFLITGGIMIDTPQGL